MFKQALKYYRELFVDVEIVLIGRAIEDGRLQSNGQTDQMVEYRNDNIVVRVKTFGHRYCGMVTGTEVSQPHGGEPVFMNRERLGPFNARYMEGILKRWYEENILPSVNKRQQVEFLHFHGIVFGNLFFPPTKVSVQMPPVKPPRK